MNFNQTAPGAPLGAHHGVHCAQADQLMLQEQEWFLFILTMYTYT
jgi:hypothetical protein